MTRRAVLFAQLIAAFAATYLVWGATFLAIRVLVLENPPFMLAGVRFILAGLILLAWSAGRGAASPGGSDWREAAWTSLFLFAGTYGFVFWATQWLPSGIVALMMGMIPVMVTVLDVFRKGGGRPGAATWAGLGIGVAGVALLSRADLGAVGAVPFIPMVALLVAAFSWSFGTVLMLRAGKPKRPVQMAGMQMLCGGVILALVGLGVQERFDPRGLWHVTQFAAFAFLVLGGSIAAFGSYVWLLGKVPPAAASSYAYVNPVIAVWLGWWLLDEPVTSSVLLGGALIVLAVVLVTWTKRRKAGDPGVEDAHDRAAAPGQVVP